MPKEALTPEQNEHVREFLRTQLRERGVKQPALARKLDIAQPTLSHHLKKLREARLIDVERQGLWSYYYVLPDALKELSAWLTS